MEIYVEQAKLKLQNIERTKNTKIIRLYGNIPLAYSVNSKNFPNKNLSGSHKCPKAAPKQAVEANRKY